MTFARGRCPEEISSSSESLFPRNRKIANESVSCSQLFPRARSESRYRIFFSTGGKLFREGGARPLSEATRSYAEVSAARCNGRIKKEIARERLTTLTVRDYRK